MRHALLCPLLILALSACPPAADPGDDAGSADAGPEATAYCETIVDFFCPYYLRCGRMAVADEAECRTVFLEACNARYEPTYQSLEEAGLLALDDDGVAACRDHLADVPCEQQLLDLDGPCAGMWQGTQPVGAPCGFDVESFACAPGAACVLDLSLCGTCHRVVEDGERCDVGEVTCTATSLCNDLGVCAPRRHVGETCSPDERCVLGATCVNAGADNICQGPTYVGIGDACDFDNRCPYASACRSGQCTASAELGQACGGVVACDSGFCDLSVDAQGECVALVEQGGPCLEGAQCQTGVCNEGTCSRLPSACFNPPVRP